MILLVTFLSLNLASLQDQLEMLLDKGYDQYIEGQYKEAVQTFSEAIKLDETNPESYFLRGLSFHGMTEVEKSVMDLEKAIELDPYYVDAYRELGYIYLVGQAPEEAIDAFDKALEIDPNQGEVYVNRGTAKCMMDDVAGAKKDWEKAVEFGIQYSEMMVCE